MKRLYAIRGEETKFRSDRGTNFVDATDALHMEAINVENASVNSLLHASNMGGLWERLVGIAGRIYVLPPKRAHL